MNDDDKEKMVRSFAADLVAIRDRYFPRNKTPIINLESDYEVIAKRLTSEDYTSVIEEDLEKNIT